MRDFLGGFGFRGDDVNAPVRNFSGGEKSRLALALLVRRKPALLLLDEPTNHLDMDMREALATALGEFEGAVVIIAHDRHLLDATVDEFLLVNEGRVEPWDGNLDDYAAWLRRRPAEALPEAQPAPAPEPEPAGNSRERRREAAQKRAELKPLQDKVTRLERELAECQASLEEIEAQLSDSGLYGEDRKDELTDLLNRQGEKRRQYEELEAELLEAMEELEAAQAEAG
jgi:ATP-binding cassette subfamily F protein 3